MKKLLVLIISAAMLALGAESGQDLFQKALVKERTEGNLREAVKLYQRIVEKHSSDRKLAAKALLQIGQCHEKLGSAEARKAYEKLVRDFGDQSELVTEARIRLAALGKPESAGVVVRKVWFGPSVDVEGAPSPDGRYLSFVDWETGDLAVRDLETGTNRRLTNKGAWKESQEYALFSRWSPDGKQVVYDWWGPSTVGGISGWGGIRVVGLDGSKPRILYHPKGVGWGWPQDWSPDGKHVLALVENKDGVVEIALISVADGTARVVKALGSRWPHAARFSPNGRYIVYDRPQAPGSAEHDVFVIPTEGAQESPLIEHPANDFLLGWAPDGKWVLFGSDRTGSPGFWAVQTVDGKPRGEPQVVKLDMPPILPMGFTRDGSFYYGYGRLATDVYVASLDPKAGLVAGTAQKLVKRFEGANASGAYSPDGKYLAYLSGRSSPGLGPGSPNLNLLRIRSLDSGQERELALNLRLISLDALSWFADGRSLLLGARDMDLRLGIYEINVQTGEAAALVQEGPGISFHGQVAARQGKAFFYVRLEKAKDLCQIVFRDLATGQERELYRAPFIERFTLSLSPDGRWLAFLNRTDNRVLRITPANGGEPRELYRFVHRGNHFINHAWTADGKHILLSRWRSEQGSPWTLWRVPVAGGEPQEAGLEMRCDTLSVHPDGQRIAFSASSRPVSSEVWVMENFLPELKAIAENR